MSDARLDVRGCPRPNTLSYIPHKIGSYSWKGQKEAFLQGAAVKGKLVQL